MSLLLESIVVFFIVFTADILWAKYIRTVSDGHKLSAANYSALVYIFAAMAITEYVGNKWMIIPACLGAWCGTYIGMKYGHGKEET